MVYCVRGFSYNPRFRPLFEPINDDGSDFIFAAPRSGRWNLNGGYRLTTETSPSLDSVYRFARLIRKRKTLPGLFLLPGGGGVPCASQLVRDCIEAIEPGVHQFLPVRLFQPDRTEILIIYYILNICVLLDSVIFEKSNLRIEKFSVGKSLITHGPISNDFRTVNGATVNNHHIWREKIYPRDIYISDILFDNFDKNKIRGIERHNYIEATVEG